jgi:hypothetical protein
MGKQEVMVIFFLMILAINVISTFNQLFFKDEVAAYGEKKEKKIYKDGEYKIYNDYLVQDPLKYGTVESELSEQQKSLYLSQSNSKCPTCTDMTSTGNSDLDSLISVIEKNLDDDVLIPLIQLFNEIE